MVGMHQFTSISAKNEENRDNNWEKHCVINIGISQREQNDGMKLHTVWQRFMKWKWARRELSDVEGEQFTCFTILWRQFDLIHPVNDWLTDYVLHSFDVLCIQIL